MNEVLESGVSDTASNIAKIRVGFFGRIPNELFEKLQVDGAQIAYRGHAFMAQYPGALAHRINSFLELG